MACVMSGSASGFSGWGEHTAPNSACTADVRSAAQTHTQLGSEREASCVRPSAAGSAHSRGTAGAPRSPLDRSYAGASMRTASVSDTDLAGLCGRTAPSAAQLNPDTEPVSSSKTEEQDASLLSDGAEGGPPAAWSAEGIPDVVQRDFFGDGRLLGRAPSLSIGIAENQGRRPSMEDAHALYAQLPGAPPGCSFFLVCDGHAGHWVAKQVAELLPLDVAWRLSHCSADPAVLLPAACLEVDRHIFREEGMSDCGAAAVAVLLRGPELWVANLGDCRAVVCDAGRAVALTRDHRASDPREKARVQAAGAFVAFGRVCATLMVTRTFGDYGFKGSLLTGPATPVSNIPELARFVLTSQSQFVLLACDGVFDVLSNEQAIAVALQHRDKGPQAMAQAVVSCTLAKGSADNVTAAVVTFDSPDASGD
eukprot:TRINITY_DN6088_c0_g1_i1.p1 TRINITY_DN6088_c0_g1~~TRINITY_DN6088_c0_g1_i1.p1  ORF type:complete len:467 (+),score=57.46 TRINITY_DN6088_c0_g1_i1:133-1401(+)